MNPFETLAAVQEQYLRYVHTFQRFRNPSVRDWVAERVKAGTLLWKDPYIEVTRPFAPGEPFASLVSSGLLHPDAPAVFTVESGKRALSPVALYQHQSAAIRSILGGRNTVVATGTGSGKSFCFAVPIVSEALRLHDQKVRGIKAVIVYPMNALANSQYEDLAKRLAGSGLSIALYTGDTPNSPAEALEQYQQVFGRDKPFDSEVLSRDEIHQRLPDILMTNYVQLELLLTRFEDRVLFPPSMRGVLRFLVLDEIHTYTGKRGADVACLIRRLKQHTGTTGTLRCIGTSATVESGEGESSASIVADFAARLFGEPFAADSVIGETYAPLPGTLAPDVRRIIEAVAARPQTLSEVAGELGLSPGEIQASLLQPGSPPPKLHAFFSQGRAITACLRPSDLHLNDRGERTCPLCTAEGRADVPTYPLYFCRCCGQEFYGVTWMKDGSLRPHDLDAPGGEGEAGYIYAALHNMEQAPLPDGWVTPKGELSSGYRSAAPREERYCPDCHRLVGAGAEAGREGAPACAHSRSFAVSWISEPLLLCPQCGVTYDRRVREFTKLFTFGTVGRSTATDVLIRHTLEHVEPAERKTIAFSDNRQDTALQSAHLNNLQKRLAFRQALYATLTARGCTEAEGGYMPLTEVGLRLFETMEAAGALPEYRRDASVHDYASEERYQRYLLYATLLDLEDTRHYTHRNLEDVGLLSVHYDGLDEFAADTAPWANVPTLGEVDAAVRRDYLLGFLESMRKRLAIGHAALLNPHELRTSVLERLNEEAFFHSTEPRVPVGFSDTAEVNPHLFRVDHFSTGRTSLVVWTQRALGLDFGTAVALVPQVVMALAREEAAFLRVHVHQERRGALTSRHELYVVNPEKIMLQVSDRTAHLACPRCGTVYHFRELRCCAGTSCVSPLAERELRDDYYRTQYTTSLQAAVPVVAEEHSGQVQGQVRKEIEARFKDPGQPLNVLVCTPTMELGIDIGDLNSIYMRNVPPSPSRYAQRAGRAGRRGGASLITVFCGVGSRRGPHDQYFYRFPHKIISGRIAAPRFLLDNQQLLVTHIHSLVLETLGQGLKLHSRPGVLLDLDQPPRYPLRSDLEAEYRTAVASQSQNIVSAVKMAFAAEMADLPWLNDEFITRTVASFVDELDKAFDRWRREYSRLNDEVDQINHRQRTERPDASLARRGQVIVQKLYQMREGKDAWYVYRYLGAEGFLPNYAFPRLATITSFAEVEDELERDPMIALSEFAPGNFLYYRGSRYEVTHARPRTVGLVPEVRDILLCPTCGAVYLGEEARRAACRCGKDLRDTHPRRALALPDMFAMQRARITADEEERQRRGFDITPHYQPGVRRASYAVFGKDGEAFRLSHEHNGRIVLVNEGPRQAEESERPEGFALCPRCNRWLLGSKAVEEHAKGKSENRCRQNVKPEELLERLVLYTDVQTDVLELDVPLPQGMAVQAAPAFYTTLKHAWLQAVAVARNLDEHELGGFLTPNPDVPGQFRIVLYETAEGGAGALAALVEGPRLRQVVERAREILHEKDPEGGCEHACYDCLLTFYNQMEHELIDRALVLPWFRSLEDLRLERAEQQTVGPTLEELEGRCGSELERQVLRALNEKGLRLPDEAQKTLYDGDAPLAVADLYYEPGVVVFVDGSPHYRDYVAAADEGKRQRLKAMGWRVFVVRPASMAEDLEALRGAVA